MGAKKSPSGFQISKHKFKRCLEIAESKGLKVHNQIVNKTNIDDADIVNVINNSTLPSNNIKEKRIVKLNVRTVTFVLNGYIYQMSEGSRDEIIQSGKDKSEHTKTKKNIYKKYCFETYPFQSLITPLI